MSRKFSVKIRETPEGREIDVLEGDLYCTDYSDIFSENEKSPDFDVQEVIQESLEIISGRQSKMSVKEARDFHGLILVLADIYGREGKLQLATPIGNCRLTTNNYVESPEDLADNLYGIGVSKDHDGAIIIDSKTGRILGYHVWLLSSPFDCDGLGYNGNGDGTRKSIAQQYSSWAWVDAIYTISERNGSVGKYTKKGC